MEEMRFVACLLALQATSCSSQSRDDQDLAVPDLPAVMMDAAESDLAETGPHTIVLTAGAAGSMFPGQSYNGENRGVDIAPVVRPVLLRGISVSALSQVGATGTFYLYDSNGQQLASATAPIDAAGKASATLGTPQMLAVGKTYRLSFLQPLGSTTGTGDFFVPMNVPYLEATSLLNVGPCWDGITTGAAVPTTPNTLEPLFVLTVD
jgi:hypothetical protein